MIETLEILANIDKVQIGDVLGLGIDFAKNEFFWTKNGIFCGKQARQEKRDVYLVVSGNHPIKAVMRIFSEISSGFRLNLKEISVNFGSQKFVFDVNSLMNHKDENEKKEYKEITFPSEEGQMRTRLDKSGYLVLR